MNLLGEQSPAEPKKTIKTVIVIRVSSYDKKTGVATPFVASNAHSMKAMQDLAGKLILVFLDKDSNTVLGMGMFNPQSPTNLEELQIATDVLVTTSQDFKLSSRVKHIATHRHKSPHIATHRHTSPHIATQRHTTPHNATQRHTTPNNATQRRTTPHNARHNAKH